VKNSSSQLKILVCPVSCGRATRITEAEVNVMVGEVEWR